MPEESRNNRLSVLLGRLKDIRRNVSGMVLRHRVWFAIGFLVLVSALVIWARFGFTLEIGRFFAAPPGCPRAGETFCRDDNVWEFFEEEIEPGTSVCGSRIVQTCSNGCEVAGGGARCIAVSTPSPTPTPSSPFTCTGGGRFCYEGPGSCPNGTTSTNGNCQSGQCCVPVQGTPTPVSTTVCQPTNRTCDGNAVFQHYSNCDGRIIQQCDSSQQCFDGQCIGPGDGQTPQPSDFPTTGCVSSAAGGGLIGTAYGDGTATVTNNTGETCTVTFASYGVVGANDQIEGQFLFDFKTRTVASGQTIGRAGLSVSAPNCRTQYDLIVGSNPIEPPYYTGRNLIAYRYSGSPTCSGTEGTPPPTTGTVPPTTVMVPPTSATPPPQTLSCFPASQSVSVGQSANMTASGGTGTYSWSAPSGSPGSGSGSTFATVYAATSGGDSAEAEGVYVVTVTSDKQTAWCTVNVQPEPQELECAPASQTVNIGTFAQVVAVGGTGTYSWSAPSGSPGSGVGSQFGTQYVAQGIYTITVQDSTTQAVDTCQVTVPTTQTPPMTTLQGVPGLQVSKVVQNVTQGSGQADSVTANPGDTVRFTVTVTSTGTETARLVTARDTLPAGLTYIGGSTTVDGSLTKDTYTTSGVALGDLVPERTVTIRFDARVSSTDFFPIGSSTLVNTAFARGSNVPEVSDVAFVVVARSPLNPVLTIQKLGRNVSRNEIGERSSVTASPNDVIEFTVRVRNISQTTAENVFVQDVVPGGVTYQSGTATLNGQPTSDTLVSGGVNIGLLVPGQEGVIRFLGRIAAANVLPEGTTTLINIARTWADNIPPLEAQLPIVITNHPITVPPVDTGPGETVALAIIISSVVTLLYVGYTSTDAFRRREARDLSSKRASGDFK